MQSAATPTTIAGEDAIVSGPCPLPDETATACPLGNKKPSQIVTAAHILILITSS